MKLHPTCIIVDGAPLQLIEPTEELGAGIVELRYDLLLNVIVGMRREAYRQMMADKVAGRVRLAQRLDEFAFHLNQAEADLRAVIELCASHIEAEKAEQNRINRQVVVIRPEQDEDFAS